MTPRLNASIVANGRSLPFSAATGVLLLLGCLVWAWTAGVTLVFGKSLYVLALMGAVRVYEHVRFRNHARLILLTDSLIVVCVMGAGIGFLSYLIAMADAPLRDRELAIGSFWRGTARSGSTGPP